MNDISFDYAMSLKSESDLVMDIEKLTCPDHVINNPLPIHTHFFNSVIISTENENVYNFN